MEVTMSKRPMRHFGRAVTVLAISALFLLDSCADMFQSRIPMTGGKTSGSLGDLLTPPEIITKLDTPAQFYAASYYSASEIRLAWEAVQGASSYIIERATVNSAQTRTEEPGDEDYETLEQVYAVSYTDTVLKNASLDAPEYQNTYYYRVKACNPVKNYDASEPTQPQAAMLFPSPGNVRASGGTSTDWIDITWEPSAAAISYEVWRSENADGASASLLQTVTGNQTWYRNRISESQQGKDFYYMVTAVNSARNKSLRTKPAYGYARVFGAPESPANVRIETGAGRGNSTNEIKIRWDAALETDTYYAVYRSSSVDASLTRLTEKTDEAAWTDKQNLKPGVYYYYVVQAIIDDIASGKALKSEFSSGVIEGFILSPPDTVVAEKKPDGTIIIKWLPSIGSEGERSLYTYKVYADNSLNGTFEALVSNEIPADTDAQGYIASEVPGDAGAFFKVSAVNGVAESAKSVTVSPAPDAALIQSASQHEFVPAAANAGGVYPVIITWKKPEGETPAFYHVQRSTRTGGGFSRVNETVLGANGPFSEIYSWDAQTGIFTYIDRNDTAKAGRKYYYRVLSLNQLEQGNFPSEERIGWGALTNNQYMIEYNKTMKAALKKLTLMHKPGSTDKLGSETKKGAISGSIAYNAAISGLGAKITIRLENYAEHYIENDQDKGVYFTLTGNSNTTASMDQSGSMNGTMRCEGMYPGYVYYDGITIRGGAAAGGTYGIHPDGGFQRTEIPWTVGEQ